MKIASTLILLIIAMGVAGVVMPAHADRIRIPALETTAKIHWYTSTLDAYVAAVENRLPLVVFYAGLDHVAKPGETAWGRKLYNEIDCPEFNALAGKAIFCRVEDVMKDEYALKLARHLKITEYPTVFVLAPNLKEIKVVARSEGYFTARDTANYIAKFFAEAVKPVNTGEAPATPEASSPKNSAPSPAATIEPWKIALAPAAPKIEWRTDVHKAFLEANEKRLPVVIVYLDANAPRKPYMESPSVAEARELSGSELNALAGRAVFVRVDDVNKDWAAGRIANLRKIKSYPTTLLLTPDMKEVTTVLELDGFFSAEKMASALARFLPRAEALTNAVK